MKRERCDNFDFADALVTADGGSPIVRLSMSRSYGGGGGIDRRRSSLEYPKSPRSTSGGPSRGERSVGTLRELLGEAIEDMGELSVC